MSFPMSNGAMSPFNMPMNMMSFPPQMLAMLAQQAAGASSPIASQPPPMVPQMQENFNTALMDIMKMYGAIPGGMPMNPWSTLPGTQVPHPFMQSTGGSSGSGTAVRDGSSAASGSRRDTESPSLLAPRPPPRSPPILSTSIKRKRKLDPGYDSSGESEVVSDEDDQDEPFGRMNVWQLEGETVRPFHYTNCDHALVDAPCYNIRSFLYCICACITLFTPLF